MDVTMQSVECGCGIGFMVPKYFYDQRHEKGGKFYCPNGHELSWKESEADRLRRERDRAVQQLAQKDDEISTLNQRLAAAFKGRDDAVASFGRLQKRVTKGVCPCCHRTFAQLAAHMKQKHPTYAAEGVNDRKLPLQ